MIYECCDGRVSDMEALERKNFMDFQQTLNIFLEKVERREKQIKEHEAKFKSNKK
mgnify:FL=1